MYLLSTAHDFVHFYKNWNGKIVLFYLQILFGLIFVFDPFLIQIVAVLLKLIHTLKISKDSRARKQWFSTSESFETILLLSLNY